MTALERKRLNTGLLFIGPWIFGFFLLSVYPVVASFYFSLCDYSVLSPPVYIGWQNYVDLVFDELFWKSLYNTIIYASLLIPLGFLVSFTLALLLNFDLPGKGLFRAVIFLPSLVPMVCLAVIWRWMLNGEFGLVNTLISPLASVLNHWFGTHLQPPSWLQEAVYTKLGLVLASLWCVGNAVVIYLAGLQDVPRHLYEAAEIDGANFWHKTWHITIPVISPVIYFNCIMALIGSFQVFAVPYVMMLGGDGPDGIGGPDRSLLFIATYIYQNAFDYWNMGYACAIGLILFFVILGLTLFATKISASRVYYAGS